MTARRWLVQGFVQGVGFRWFVHRHAVRLGLRGFVRNLADGTVEVIADGPEDAIRGLEEQLRRGPSAASVQHVEQHEVQHELTVPKTFEIR